MDYLVDVENLFERFLGKSKDGFTDRSQIQFNCPACSNDAGVDYDGKYNLEINIYRNKFRCWKCEHENNMHGSVKDLIERYGNHELFGEYKAIYKSIKESKDYIFALEEHDELLSNEVKLPEPIYEFKFDGNKKESKPLNYLLNRGINQNLIEKYNLMYTTYECKKEFYKYKNRIIIPSYDKFNQLNYFTGRDYTGNNKYKYSNSDNSKTEICFNEHLLNFDFDVTLVEGPTDHIVTPNSEPLLGKVLTKHMYIYNYLFNKVKGNIYVFLDDDAYSSALDICKLLYNAHNINRLYIIPTKELRDEINEKKHLDLEKLDPSKLFELYGYKGIAWAYQKAIPYSEELNLTIDI